ALLSGVPLLTGVNLLRQYPQLGIDGALVVATDKGAPDEPTKTNLGTYSHLIFVQE
ncbi:phage baseplate plug family protein, partial [Escherichia coli]